VRFLVTYFLALLIWEEKEKWALNNALHLCAQCDVALSSLVATFMGRMLLRGDIRHQGRAGIVFIMNYHGWSLITSSKYYVVSFELCFN
jgi:hypothetical protein